MKQYFTLSLLFIFFTFGVVAQVDSLILSFNATSLTEEQKKSNLDYLAYPLMFDSQMSEIDCNQTIDCMEPVDLGLSVMWATCNVGAEKPEDYGDYFAWGETQPKNNYNWSTYKYCLGTNKTMIKYCTSSSYGHNGFTDNKTVLDPKDDAATVNWGGSWRMPTKEEQDELINNCTWTWTTQSGVNGYKVVGPNGNSIFLPAAGYRNGTSLNDEGSFGFYWLSSLFPRLSYYVYYAYFYSNSVYEEFSYRYYGFTVRPVCPKKQEPECVDLGLSVNWATCNVGAESLEDYGDYFAWGETKPKKNYDWTTYKYCKGTDRTITKYCDNSSYGNNGFIDNKIVLEPEDDAATVNWGGAWRMPTEVEQNELREQCEWIWITQNGVKGYKVVGSNGNSIFLPAAGCYYDSPHISAGSLCLFWSSSLYSDPSAAYYVYSYSRDVLKSAHYRYCGLTVRPVCPKEPKTNQIYKFIDKDTICGNELPYIWRRKNCTTTGLYSDSLKSVLGGDSVYVLELTVLPEVVGKEESVTICYGESYKWNGKEYSKSGVYKDTLRSAQGCDSVVTLSLEVAPSYGFGETVIIRSGESYPWRGEMYTAAGVYFDKLLTVDGCDSVFTLTLIVEDAEVEDVIVQEINIAEQCAGSGVMEVDVFLQKGDVDSVIFEFSQEGIDAGLINMTLPYGEPIEVQYDDVRAGEYKVTVKGLYNGTKVFEQQVDLTFLYPSTVLKQEWNDVITVLAHDYNGGYNFVEFQWFKNGMLLVGETYFYIHKTLDFGAEYSALLTEDNGTQLMTCPLIATENVDAVETECEDVLFYPILLSGMQRIKCRVSETSIVYIYDMMSKLIHKHKVEPGETELDISCLAGVYMAKIVTMSNVERNVKLIVQ